MSVMASPPPELPSAANALSDQLDDDINQVRAEIEKLRERRSLLSASLLSSTEIQNLLRSRQTHPPTTITTISASTERIDPSTDTNPLSSTTAAIFDHQNQHNESNIHRLAFGITSFPFTDPNPETSDEPLLGIRFDVPSPNPHTNTGRYDKAPYYVFCKRIDPKKTNDVTIHHHTIPAFVPIQSYIDKFLPTSPPQSSSGANNSEATEYVDEGYHTPSSSTSSPQGQQHTATPRSRQDLHQFASHVYTDLKSHAIRQASIQMLRAQLGLLSSSSLPSLRASATSTASRVNTSSSHLVKSFDPAGVDCRFARLIWVDGTVGRIRISDEGFVEKVVVVGEEGRLHDVERVIGRSHQGKKIKIADLKERLAEVEAMRKQNPKTSGDLDDEDTQMNGVGG